MQIYISKNNQQSGPFDEKKVLEMLSSGQLAGSDFGIRHGEQNWVALSQMFQSSPPAQINGNQNLVNWAQQNLPQAIEIAHKSFASELSVYLIFLLIAGILPLLVGFGMARLSNPAIGIALMVIGGVLLVVLSFLFFIIFLVNRFSNRKNACAFNAQGLVGKNNTLYEWQKLKYVNYHKFRSTQVRGNLVAALISSVILYFIRLATIKDKREKSFSKAEFVFESGTLNVPVRIRNFSEIWDLIEKLPVQSKLEGKYDQNTPAELEGLGLNLQSGASVPISAAENQKSGNGLAVAIAAVCGLLLVGGLGLFTILYLFFGLPSQSYATSDSLTGKNSDLTNKSSSSTKSNSEAQIFADPSPEKKADFSMSADEFIRDTQDAKKMKQSLEKYEGKVIDITGRVYLFTAFDGKKVYLRTSGSPLAVEFDSPEAKKLENPVEDERVRAKCTAQNDIGFVLKNCFILERKPIMLADETPDFSLTSKEFWEQIEDSKLSYEARKKNREKYFGKIVAVSGNVKKISGDGHFLSVKENEWVTCYPDDKYKKLFTELAEGQAVVFRGVDDGIALKHCAISK